LWHCKEIVLGGLNASLTVADGSGGGMRLTQDIWWELGILRRKAFGIEKQMT
jgi:hypothetical protein